MKFVIPVLFTRTVVDEPLYSAGPLFHGEPVVSARLIERAQARLVGELRKVLKGVAEERRLDLFADYNYYPNFYDKSFELTFHLKKRTVSGKFLVVVLPDTEPRVAFFPQFPNLWFQLGRGEDLRQRSCEVLDRYLSKGAGKSVESEKKVDRWLGEVEFSFKAPEKPPRRRDASNMMILGGPPVGEGWAELEMVGRCLDDDYPHDLGRSLCRDREMSRLSRALDGDSRVPQLITGERRVGKTALLHEVVRQFRENNKGKRNRRFWLLSPQRLISGMSFVGQWEARLLAILKYAKSKDLVLIVDDLLGLFSAGVSRDSNLCLADVLKPYLQRGEVRLLGECTNEGLAVLRERDRGFADLFSVTHLPELDDARTWQVAVSEMRDGERRHRCRFALEALSAAMNLQRRYVRDAAFPGKVATFLSKLAARRRNREVEREHALEYFHSTSGVALDILDDRIKLKREDVVRALSDQVLGQREAVEAAADAVMLAKSRLADPTRPVASLLFVGPTGVGKTECAKALAGYLFGDESRLLRFDMNEYISPMSATRLVGTFHQPDGLLTSAVRRRPFCVLLLDEIEKAHHEVFNLLLQLLGDGRLTDSRGRTVDFTQTIVILTSNLGVSEASRPIGLRSKETEESLTYRRAVEDFFPPEFFNRLDRVVPFSRLSRKDTETLATGLIKKVLSREGLVRRQCILEVDPQAMEAVVDMGFHPQLGARALKRSIEQHISAPVSARLTEMKPHTPTVISLLYQDGLKVSVEELKAASPVRSQFELSAEGLTAVEEYLQSLEDSLESPEGLLGEEMTAAQIWYYSLQDEIRVCRAIVRRTRSYLESEQPVARRNDPVHSLLPASHFSDVLSGSQLLTSLQRCEESLPTKTEDIQVQRKWLELLAHLALTRGDGTFERTAFTVRFKSAAQPLADSLLRLYRSVAELLELESSWSKSEGEIRGWIQGPSVKHLFQAEDGTHLFATDNGILLVEVAVGDDSEVDTQTERSVVRVYQSEHRVLDLRTGWMCRGDLDEQSGMIMILGTAFCVDGEFRG